MEILKQKLIAGVDWNFEESLADYSSVDYDLKYILKHEGDDPFEIDSVDQENGTGFVFTLDDTETADLPAGLYVVTLQAILKTDSTDKTGIDEGAVEIFANVGLASDPRSYALQMIENLRAQLLTLSNQVYSSIALEDGKSLILNQMELIRSQLRIWEIEAGLRKGGRVHKIDFTRNS